MWIKRNVVMLPTNEKATLGLNSIHNHLFFANDMAEIPTQKYQHLYFLSDEEIKEGDWMYNLEREPSILKCVGKGSLRGWKKIIATTDKYIRLLEIVKEDGNIEYPYITPFPQPSQSFIEKFVEEYNKGNVITEVMVEYEKHTPAFTHIGKTPSKQERLRGCYDNGEQIVGIWSEETLKVNPKDNTITIRKVNLKGEHVLNFVNDFIKEFPEENLEYLKLRAESWIEQNL